LEVLAVEDFSELRLSLDGMQARMDVDVYNPNPYAVTVTRADVKLYVNQEVVGDVTLVEDQIIRPDAQATAILRVATRDGALGRVLKNDLMNLLRGAEVPFVAEGSVTGKAFGLSFTVPLRHDQSLNIRP
jgi:LEA14-like dessication related protein